MEITDSMSTADQIDFMHLYAALFLNETCNEYNQALQGIFMGRGDKYSYNKAKDGEKACNSLITAINRHLLKDMDKQSSTALLEAVQFHKQVLHDMFSLEIDEQHRVRNLINKIKRERK